MATLKPKHLSKFIANESIGQRLLKAIPLSAIAPFQEAMLISSALFKKPKHLFLLINGYINKLLEDVEFSSSLAGASQFLANCYTKLKKREDLKW